MHMSEKQDPSCFQSSFQLDDNLITRGKDLLFLREALDAVLEKLGDSGDLKWFQEAVSYFVLKPGQGTCGSHFLCQPLSQFTHL